MPSVAATVSTPQTPWLGEKGPPLAPRANRALWALIAAGTVVRVVLAFRFVGSQYDIQSLELVRNALSLYPLHVYAHLPTNNGIRFPYPPGLFPWVYLAGKLSNHTGLAFHGVIKLPAIAADAALAWLVQEFLGRRGASTQVRLIAVALVTLGTSFAGISGYLGQIDSLAILPAFLAMMIWEGGDMRRRAVIAGLLIGVGAALKTVPILMLVALLPTARTRREAGVLISAAVIVPLIVLSPYLITDFGPLRAALRYAGVAGEGGLTLALQPDYARRWLTTPNVHESTIFHAVTSHGILVNALVLLPLLALLRWRRVRAPEASVILWLAVYSFGTGFLFQYLVWGLPFFLAAGYLWPSAVLQVWALVPMVLVYDGPWKSDRVVVIFVSLMLALWVGFLGTLLVFLRRLRFAERPAGNETPA